tara:strand:+ start:436 stop:654 length:219 start_codon:yes stop_codon:yes gene_type:complete
VTAAIMQSYLNHNNDENYFLIIKTMINNNQSKYQQAQGIPSINEYLERHAKPEQKTKISTNPRVNRFHKKET